MGSFTKKTEEGERTFSCSLLGDTEIEQLLDESLESEPIPTPLQFQAFLDAVDRYQLNPLGGQIYLMIRQGRMRAECQIHGLRAIAERTGEYAGSDVAKYDDTLTAFDIEASRRGDPNHHPLTATVTVYKLVAGERCGFTDTATWSMFAGRKSDGGLNRMWAQGGPYMLAKCAEALALRKAFPDKLAGLYTDDEMNHQPTDEPKQERKPFDPTTAAVARNDARVVSESAPIDPVEVAALADAGSAVVDQEAADKAAALEAINVVRNRVRADVKLWSGKETPSGGARWTDVRAAINAALSDANRGLRVSQVKDVDRMDLEHWELVDGYVQLYKASCDFQEKIAESAA